ncbi:hypothetical protein MKX03_003555, partial [Papaver bracteatum]
MSSQIYKSARRTIRSLTSSSKCSSLSNEVHKKIEESNWCWILILVLMLLFKVLRFVVLTGGVGGVL